MTRFHSLIPEEVAFYRLFPFIDFHDLLKVIPHVCSSWRRVIIEKLETLHFYPNVEINISKFDQEEFLLMENTIIQNNLFPFIRYTIKFVESNRMKIKYLFINGQFEDIVCRKQFHLFGHLNPLLNKKVFIMNRVQRESLEFYKRLESLNGGYFPNCLTEPALRRVTADNTRMSSYNKNLGEYLDSGTLRELVRICKDVELVSLSNFDGEYTNVIKELLITSKIAVVDNSRFYWNGSGNFQYLFYSDNFYIYEKQLFEYCESRNNLIICPEKDRWGFTPIEIIDPQCRVVDYNIISQDFSYYGAVSEKDIRNTLEILCKNLVNPQLRRLTLGLDYFTTRKYENIAFDYGRVGEMIEELYIRAIGNTFSKIKLDSFVSGFVNVKHLVLENVKSQDCNLLIDSISGMSHLETFRASCYDHQGSEDEQKYFELLSSLSRNYKNLTKVLFQFPYMQGFENETFFIETVSNPLRKCWIVLKRLPDLSEETTRKLGQVLNLSFNFKPKISNDSSFTQIDYDQDIDSIIENRKQFKQALQESEVVCPACLKVLPRHRIAGHLAAHHKVPDLQKTSLTRTLSVCPCCKEEYPSKDVEEHLLTCSEKHSKFKLEDTTSCDLYRVGYYPPDFGNK